ncbi:hypothetical protein ACS5PU_00090 [Pedobacter sp. GSP4]|uniref:hypothetical protein n=1 Tax=Pedobacter sp. GSP4 TaxID=3453716 RepID=UPI003EEE75BF
MQKTVKYLMVSLIAILTIASCKKEINWNAQGQNTSPGGNGNTGGEQNSEYYISYKANVEQISIKDVLANRNATESPRKLIVFGNKNLVSQPKFKIYSEESIIGFEKGLNVGNSDFTAPGYYVEFTDKLGVLYSTANDAKGVNYFISDISYKKDGFVQGTFSGQATAANSAVINITEGKFKAKFSD